MYLAQNLTSDYFSAYASKKKIYSIQCIDFVILA